MRKINYVPTKDDLFYASYTTEGSGKRDGKLDIVLTGKAVSVIAGEDVDKYPRSYYQHPYASFASRLTTAPYIHLLVNTKRGTVCAYTDINALEYDKAEDVELSNLNELVELANEYTKHHRKCPAVEYIKDDVHCKGNFYVPSAPKEWEARNWG